MLSRTASCLYWLGRYVERAEFTARLVEATLRLDALSTRPAGDAAWLSAMKVLDADIAFAATGQALTPRNVTRFLTVSVGHPGSVLFCLNAARDNAKAVRTALSREAWSAKWSKTFSELSAHSDRRRPKSGRSAQVRTPGTLRGIAAATRPVCIDRGK